jgi:hypothetical protein
MCSQKTREIPSAMQIKLLPYERRALEALALTFSLERDLVVGFAELPQRA